MGKAKETIEIAGLIGRCGDREVFLGFAPASILHKLSFADVLDESTGDGYQRRFSDEHSLEFRKYIRTAGATTIPLTFNLRPALSEKWKIKRLKGNAAVLSILDSALKVFAQVDCQHRLGFLADHDVPLAFMTFIGLSVRDEMAVFNVINGKAKGLSSSLLDFHQAKLSQDLSSARPELFIALQLTEDSTSPWHQRLDLGGHRTVGMHRYASLRTMQKAVKRFLKESRILERGDTKQAVSVVLAYWQALSMTLEREWKNPRKYLLTKGIGVYSLMSLAGDLYRDAERLGVESNKSFFLGALSDFIKEIDWSNTGPLRGLGGTSGADHALELIRNAKRKSQIKMVTHVK